MYYFYFYNLLECIRTTTECDHYIMKKNKFISFTEYLIFLPKGTFI